MEEASGIRRYGFEVAPLRLGIERAEGERGFAGAGDSSEDDQRIAGNLDIHTLQVVLARAAHANETASGLLIRLAHRGSAIERHRRRFHGRVVMRRS